MAATTKSRCVRVIGIGNPDRGDDGVGAAVVAALGHRSLTGVDLLTKGGDMLALVDDLEGGDAIVCIDAAAGRDAGRIHRFDLAAEELPRDVAFVSSHAFGLPEAFALARSLDIMPQEVIVYAVEGSCFDHGAAMSAAVAAAVEAAADRVAAEIERLRTPSSETPDA